MKQLDLFTYNLPSSEDVRLNVRKKALDALKDELSEQGIESWFVGFKRFDEQGTELCCGTNEMDIDVRFKRGYYSLDVYNMKTKSGYGTPYNMDLQTVLEKIVRLHS